MSAIEIVPVSYYRPAAPPSALVLTVAVNRVQMYIDNAKARNTIRGYRSDWRQFEHWCGEHGLHALPSSPETIAGYLADRAGALKVSTLEHHLSAIAKAHKAAGLSSPVKENMLIAETLKGIKRVDGMAPVQKAPVLTEDLRLMLRHTPAGMIGIRDRALLLGGFAGAFRRSELVSLDVSDLAFTGEGLLITLRRSKTDQEGQGRSIALPFGSNASTCPVKAMRAWLETAIITEGPVFRSIQKGGRVREARLSDKSVANVVKRYACAAGLDPAIYSGHSLRAGLVTSAARSGVPERVIMRQTGHKSIDMVLKYVRQANAFTENAVNALGL
jgi:site-specific recombinase XerD